MNPAALGQSSRRAARYAASWPGHSTLSRCISLKEEYAAFWTAYQQDRDLLRFHYHRPREIWENLKDLDPVSYTHLDVYKRQDL